MTSRNTLTASVALTTLSLPIIAVYGTIESVQVTAKFGFPEDAQALLKVVT